MHKETSTPSPHRTSVDDPVALKHYSRMDNHINAGSTGSQDAAFLRQAMKSTIEILGIQSIMDTPCDPEYSEGLMSLMNECANDNNNKGE